MPRDIPTRFGFPPIPREIVFPTEPPYDAPIHTLSGIWLVVECHACPTKATLPFRRMSADVGWKVTLRAVLGRLRCQKCGRPPGETYLIDDPARDTIQYGFGARKLPVTASDRRS